MFPPSNDIFLSKLIFLSELWYFLTNILQWIGDDPVQVHEISPSMEKAIRVQHHFRRLLLRGFKGIKHYWINDFDLWSSSHSWRSGPCWSLLSICIGYQPFSFLFFLFFLFFSGGVLRIGFYTKVTNVSKFIVCIIWNLDLRFNSSRHRTTIILIYCLH